MSVKYSRLLECWHDVNSVRYNSLSTEWKMGKAVTNYNLQYKDTATVSDLEDALEWKNK